MFASESFSTRHPVTFVHPSYVNIVVKVFQSPYERFVHSPVYCGAFSGQLVRLYTKYLKLLRWLA